MSKEEILAIIKENPEAIIESLSKKPELLINLILKLAPWDRFATKEDIKMLIELFNKRFEDINKRFEDVNKRFEDLIAYSNKRFEELKTYSDKRFEAIDKRFEDINRRFEDLRYYVDKRIGLIEKLLIGFNIPILATVLTMLIKLFIK
jgi:hypothetical protein